MRSPRDDKALVASKTAGTRKPSPSRPLPADSVGHPCNDNARQRPTGAKEWCQWSAGDKRRWVLNNVQVRTEEDILMFIKQINAGMGMN